MHIRLEMKHLQRWGQKSFLYLKLKQNSRSYASVSWLCFKYHSSLQNTVLYYDKLSDEYQWWVSSSLHKQWSFPSRISSVNVTILKKSLMENLIFCAVVLKVQITPMKTTMYYVLIVCVHKEEYFLGASSQPCQTSKIESFAE